jgi:uncharacterized protein (TIGR02145 family)
MENVMKKQGKKPLLWGFRGLFSIALCGLGIVAFAQGAEVCQGSSYSIANTVPASAGSEYRWLENGNVLAETNGATYEVPGTKATGIYTYVRQSKSIECPDWQSSNEFTVTVFNCTFSAGTETGATATFIDPRDGKSYKTVVMPDGKTWFAQNLNYTKDLMYNAYAYEANSKQYIYPTNGVPAIGSYWCPGETNSNYSGSQNMCNIYGALYTWETAMMVDGKYADETKTSSAWDESWISPYYYYNTGTIGTAPNADKNNARGGTNVKDGGRGICPKGWHIPTAREWAVMLDKVEGNGTGILFQNSDENTGTLGTDVGVKLKSSATCTVEQHEPGAWIRTSKPGTNTTGFSAIPAGYLYATPRLFQNLGHTAMLTSASAATNDNAWRLRLLGGSAGADINLNMRRHAFTIRCISN